MTTSILSVWMTSVGWVFFTGSFISWTPLVSTNSANPLFSQPCSWTVVQASGIPAQHFILKNWSLYRTLPLKLLQNSTWNTPSNDRQRLLNLPRLSTCRTRQKLSLCYRIVTGRSITPPRFFTPHPCPHLRHNHHLSLYYPSFRTSAHKSSFSVSVVPLWNSLHLDFVSSPSCDSFKARLSL